MSIKSERTIYQVLEENLRKSDKPLTCNDLWDMDGRIRELEKDGGPNKVSDYLGFMWRKGLLIKFSAPKTSKSFARFAYQWKNEDERQITYKPPELPEPVHSNLKITEVRDGVRVELNGFSVTIQKS